MLKSRNKALFFVLLVSVFWAINIFIAKSLLLDGVEAFSILIQTQFLVVLFVGAYLALFRRETFNTIPKESLPWLLSFGAIGSGLGIGLSYIGLSLSSSINYGFIIKTSMVFTIIIAHFLHHDDRISKMKIFLGALFLLGIYLLSTDGKLILPHMGDIFIMFGALMLAISNNSIKVLTKYKVNSGVLVLFRMLGAFFVSLIFVLLLNSPIITQEYLPILVVNAIISIIFLYAINKTIDYSSASYLSMMSMVVPVIVAALGISFLGESFGFYQIVGGIMILASGVLLEKTRVKG